MENTGIYAKEGYAFKDGIPEPIPFYWERKAEEKNINNLFDEKISSYLSSYPQYEIATFETQRKEASLYRETGKSEYLVNLLKSKNKALLGEGLPEISFEEFVLRIEAKAAQFFKMYNALISWRDSERLKIAKKYK